MSHPSPNVNATAQGFSGLSLTGSSTPVQHTTSDPTMPTAPRPSTPVRSTAPPQKQDSPMSIDMMSRQPSRAQSPMEEILNSATYAAITALGMDPLQRATPTTDTPVSATSTDGAPATGTEDAPATSTDDSPAVATPTTGTPQPILLAIEGLRQVARYQVIDLQDVVKGFNTSIGALADSVDEIRVATNHLKALTICLALDNDMQIPEELRV
ncbi:hypothetical protein C8T65DRAFT_744438 [Cerioporus squamosus]|nr:hypothetical protein C8T65DRAFT_744438 [Cerioporus squamosus]